MDSELAQMRRYMLHHRIATYAIILFLVLMTFILISISRQIENEQTLRYDAPVSAQTVGTCPANGIPFRMTYNGASSCYFGQYRSVSVRCTEGARAQIINSSTLGSYSVCADKTALEAAAKARCGCVPSGSRTTPTVGVGSSGGIVVPTVGVGTSGGIVVPTLPIVKLTSSPNSLCKRGLNSFAVGIDCETDPSEAPAYRSASYACHGGKKGVVTPSNGLCLDVMTLYTQAVAACKNESSCSFKGVPISPVRLKPSAIPTFAP